ncbi:hypothetical protein F383_23387 [Gossypium arboreum]|uniref:Uncharacterized protein n=1 Tax=Gossypium arboreum TaxID=29729 RepID=A0A0B0NZA0_GOSAR|nr:hypothetical protein F383_23387 [Gossypium arboreum]
MLQIEVFSCWTWRCFIALIEVYKCC